jgi:hypothetical protein
MKAERSVRITVRVSFVQGSITQCLLGVQLKVIDKQTGITWKEYQDVLQSVNHSSRGRKSVRELAPCTKLSFLQRTSNA